MPRTADRTGSYYRDLRARVITEETHCGRCHRPVDKTISGRLPAGPTMGHKVAREDGGQLVRANMQLEHLHCNVVAENKRRAERRQERAARPSRDW